MRKWIIIGIVVAVLAVGGIVVASASGGGSGDKPVLITDVATVRDLRDEVSVPGTLERAEQRTVNWIGGGGGGTGASAASGTSVVSAVYLDDGAALNPGDRVLAVDGRTSVALPGAFPFFRKLDVGAEGSDVAQLKTILAAAGFQPGPADGRFTEQTRFALGQWQAAQRYPGAAPSTSQTVNVALQQGSGYELGPQTSAGLTIGPPPARKAAARTGVRTQADPVITIGASTTTVDRGSFATFTLVANTPAPVATDLTVSLGGTLASGDRIPSSGTTTVTLDADATSVSVQIFVLPNATAPDQTLTVTVQPGSGYTVGTPSSATVDVPSAAVPTLTVSGTTTINQGQSAVVTISADQAVSTSTQVNLSIGGNAQPDVDYVAIPPTTVIPAGQSSTTVTVQSKTSNTIKPDRFVVVGLAQSGSYDIGSTASATVTIRGQSGAAATPVVTITATNLRVNGGQPAQFVVGLDRPLTQPLEIGLTYGGNAVMGSDYNPPGGVVTVPANQTSVSVTVPTLNNGRVQPDTLLIVGLVPQSTYVVGSPDAAGTLILAPTKPKVSIYGGPAAVGLGGGVVFQVVADQPPIKDTSVQYTVTGSAQQGKDIQPVTGSVVLPAGATTVDIPILTLNTNVYFLPTDVIVTTGGGRLGQILVKEGDVVPAGTPLFTITEPNIAVTLDASAADRTKLEVGQSATVQVQGGTGSAPGVIVQLDDFPTTDPETRQQTFKGTVQVQGDLGAADGTPVTVNVVVQERVGALTVPIAAVKQNGSGKDVIRLIDLETGETREVEVVTGLSEGSYIEIKSGIGERDVVVVELDQKRS